MLRSIKKSLDEIKKEDPDTCITMHTIRTWCKEGKIKYITAGTKIMVSLENLLEYINCDIPREIKDNSEK